MKAAHIVFRSFGHTPPQQFHFPLKVYGNAHIGAFQASAFKTLKFTRRKFSTTLERELTVKPGGVLTNQVWRDFGAIIPIAALSGFQTLKFAQKLFCTWIWEMRANSLFCAETEQNATLYECDTKASQSQTWAWRWMLIGQTFFHWHKNLSWTLCLICLDMYSVTKCRYGILICEV